MTRDFGRGIFEPQEIEVLTVASARLSQQQKLWSGIIEPEDVGSFVLSVYQTQRGDADSLLKHCLEELSRLATR